MSWLLAPRQAVTYGTMVAFAFTLVALLVGIRSARYGDRIAWFGVVGVSCLLFALAGGIWIVLDRQGVPWQVHAASATAGMAYLMGIGAMMWQRYSYLIELREVLAQGPRYDPITRMQSNGATGHMIAQAFGRQQQDAGAPVTLIGVSIGNLYALEKLHGRAVTQSCPLRVRQPAAPLRAGGHRDGPIVRRRFPADLAQHPRPGAACQAGAASWPSGCRGR